MEEMSDQQVINLYNNKYAFEDKVKDLKAKFKHIKSELQKYQEKLRIANRVDEIFHGTPLETGLNIQTVSNLTNRYADHPYEMTSTEGSWAFSYGTDVFGKQDEKWSGPKYLTEDDAWEAAKRWVVFGEIPDERRYNLGESDA